VTSTQRNVDKVSLRRRRRDLTLIADTAAHHVRYLRHDNGL